MSSAFNTAIRHPLASKRCLIVFSNDDDALDISGNDNEPDSPLPVSSVSGNKTGGNVSATSSVAGGEKVQEIFELLSRYEAIAPIGLGTYGYVCCARDSEMVEFLSTAEDSELPEEIREENLEDLSPEERQEMLESFTTVAIKKLRGLFDNYNNPRMWLCATREIQLMMSFKHENVMSASDFFIPLGGVESMNFETLNYLKHNFDSVYIVMKKMDYTLREVLDSIVARKSEIPADRYKELYAAANGAKEENEETPVHDPETNLTLHPMEQDYRKFVLYQLMRGVGYMHRCMVMHRDLKPENVLLDRSYKTCVTDFGQGRDVSFVHTSTGSSYNLKGGNNNNSGNSNNNNDNNNNSSKTSLGENKKDGDPRAKEGEATATAAAITKEDSTVADSRAPSDIASFAQSMDNFYTQKGQQKPQAETATTTTVPSANTNTERSRASEFAELNLKANSAQTLLDNTTQWYAPPETLSLVAQLTSSLGYIDAKSFHGIDTWSVGCIAAEMLLGRPLFATSQLGGLRQIVKIIELLGEPSAEDLNTIAAHRDEENRELFLKVVEKVLSQYNLYGKQNKLREVLKSPYGDETEEEIELILSCLSWQPNQRITMEAALQSPYFSADGYDANIDPDDTANRVTAVRLADILDPQTGRKVLWDLFAKRHPEVEELWSTLTSKQRTASHLENSLLSSGNFASVHSDYTQSPERQASGHGSNNNHSGSGSTNQANHSNTNNFNNNNGNEIQPPQKE